ncbi:permease for cytosine/purines, uracil, thiamine, allantoin-domain-containing protein [Papiliotrema laurentii]|uniref:Permease for cytosine/purines, uracil, thiamine, allantoin-domain-containing protein n=1 Tax=Papiliotrema laurentii TaxID=5418 RepID=A0AAD9CWA4_PAPLA|nr:permease for cytosine/purines, uracil, thiamine, allantoin-domain-containing protein [Papiliotrema laurentii]
MVSFPTFTRPEPKKWFTRDYWYLETPPASYATHDGWSNADVDVVPVEQRNWRAVNYLFLWLSDGANVGTMQQAGSIVALGLSWREASVAIAVGNIIIAATVALNGMIGSRHHIPFSIASRASLGFYFSYFAVVSRMVLGLIYFGINTFIGASCMLIMLEAIWPSLKTVPNHLPASSGLTTPKMVAYVVFWTLQVPLVMIHPRKMRWLFFIKSIAAVVAAFALLGWCVHTAGGGGPVFKATSKLTGSAKSWAYLSAVNIAISGKTTLALNIPDLTRYAKKPSASWWQLLYIPIVYWTFSFIGIAVASAGQAIYGQVYWDPTAIIAQWTNRAAAFFIAFAFGLATLGTNISTNSIASSNDLAFLAPKWLNIQRGAFITAIVGGWATAPWKIQASAKSLTTFLSGYIIVLAPVVAIMIGDYWIIRKTRLHVPMLYQNEGIYRYKAGINWRALATLLIVVPINLPGLINAIDSTVYIGNYRYFYRASWLTSFFISFFLYVILSKVFPPSDTLVDKTVESLDEDEGYEGHGEAVELNSWEKNVASPSPSNGTHDQPSKASKV